MSADLFTAGAERAAILSGRPVSQELLTVRGVTDAEPVHGLFAASLMTQAEEDARCAAGDHALVESIGRRLVGEPVRMVCANCDPFFGTRNPLRY